MAQSIKRFTAPEKSLPPPLNEFRSALQDEIEVAKRSASSSAIPLNNGHRVGKQGSAFQYAFLIDSLLNTPDGAPGDLVVPDRPPMAATIVAVEGLRILISVEIDLGEFVPLALLQTNITFLMRKLIERIEDKASSNNSAASKMLEGGPASGFPIKIERTPGLNESQMQALQSALGRDLTVIWGPPGTGKTHTIGTIARFLHDSGRTVLIVSHTNAAVDQAIKHVASAMPEHLKQGAVIRVGEVRDDVLKSDFPDVLLKTQVEHQSRTMVESRNHLVSQIQRLNDELYSLQEKISVIEWFQGAQLAIQSLEGDLEELHRKEEKLHSDEARLVELENRHDQILALHQRTRSILALGDELKNNGLFP